MDKLVKFQVLRRLKDTWSTHIYEKARQARRQGESKTVVDELGKCSLDVINIIPSFCYINTCFCLINKL